MKQTISVRPFLPPPPPAWGGVIPVFLLVCAALGVSVMVLINQALGVDTATLLGGW